MQPVLLSTEIIEYTIIYKNSTSCKCGRICGELNKTNWTQHLESCGKKRKLLNNYASVTKLQ